jgi:membrane protein DedA with SNARE-associated domain
MGPLAPFLEHWGYGAVFLVVVLGSIGLPLPEETVLTLAGYLVWHGDLKLWPVLVAGVVAAAAGDNLGYFLGRRYGGAALRRFATRVGVAPARLDAGQRFVMKHGGVAIFVARFVPGLRFAAGPISGFSGVSARVFVIANVLGACCYVPLAVGIGYAVGRGMGRPFVERVRSAGVTIEHIVLGAMLVGTLSALLMRARRATQ